LSPQLDNQPFFFGCTPVSVFSHMYNHTIFFTYFDSASPNDNLVSVADAHDKEELGAYYLQYDDSQGSGNVAVVTEANITPTGVTDGRVNITYAYNDYVIGSFFARSEWFSSSLESLIGEDESKQVPQPRRRTSIVSSIFNPFASDDTTKTVMHTTASFLYNANGQVRKQTTKDNTTTWDNNKDEGDNVTTTVQDFKYKMDSNGNIIQIRTFMAGTAVAQVDFTYDPDTGLLMKACNNGCANYQETFVYDDNSCLTELHFPDGSMWKFKYDGDDNQVSTADFGADYGLFTFSY